MACQAPPSPVEESEVAGEDEWVTCTGMLSVPLGGEQSVKSSGPNSIVEPSPLPLKWLRAPSDRRHYVMVTN